METQRLYQCVFVDGVARAVFRGETLLLGDKHLSKYLDLHFLAETRMDVCVQGKIQPAWGVTLHEWLDEVRAYTEKRRRRKQRARMPKEDIERIHELHDAGNTPGRIAKEFGLSRAQVADILKTKKRGSQGANRTN